MTNQENFSKVAQEIERLKRQADSFALDAGRDIIIAHVDVLLAEVGQEHKTIVNRILRSLAQKIKQQTTVLERL